MTTFVDACLTSITDSAAKVDKRDRTRPRCGPMLKQLAGAKTILVTAHLHPDPDSLASCQAMQYLLQQLLKDAKIEIRLKGQIGGGINSAFTRIMRIDALPWDDDALKNYDAIVLLDTQPSFSNCPLPSGVTPTVVIDHHRGRGRRAKMVHSDVRINVGATASIMFSYFMEQHVTIPPDLAATLLYAIETDLAGAAGQQGGLDTLAISSLTLSADTRRYYQMRYVDLPQSYYAAFCKAVSNGVRNEDVLVSHVDAVDYSELPAVMADFLLRCEGVHWSMVTAIHEGRFVFSLRTQATGKSAGEVARRIVKGIGDAGGHFTKAGGAIPITGDTTAADIERFHKTLRRRLLRCLHVPTTRGSKLA